MEEFLLVDDDFCGNCSNNLSSTNGTSGNSLKIYNLDILIHTIKENQSLSVACEKVSVFTAIQDLLNCQFQTSDAATDEGANNVDNDHLKSANKSSARNSFDVQVPLCLSCSLLLQDLYRSFKLFQRLQDGTSYISKLTHRIQQTFSIPDVSNSNDVGTDAGVNFDECENKESEGQTFQGPFGEEMDLKINPLETVTGVNPTPAEATSDVGVKSTFIISNETSSATETEIDVKVKTEVNTSDLKPRRSIRFRAISKTTSKQRKKLKSNNIPTRTNKTAVETKSLRNEEVMMETTNLEDVIHRGDPQSSTQHEFNHSKATAGESVGTTDVATSSTSSYFTASTSGINHEKLVTGERLRTGERFRTGEKLRRREKPFGCPLSGCSYRTDYANNIQRHMEKMHVEDLD